MTDPKLHFGSKTIHALGRKSMPWRQTSPLSPATATGIHQLEPCYRLALGGGPISLFSHRSFRFGAAPLANVAHIDEAIGKF